MLGKTNSGNGGGSAIEPYTVIVTLDEDFKGNLVTLTQSTTVITKTCPMTSPYEVTFKPMNDGVWVISSTTSDGTVVTKNTQTLSAWGTYNETLESGFNFNQWLNKGRVTQTFSSLADVLADEKTVRQLMTVHDSVDYLYQSYTTKADILDDIMASTNGAKWLGLRDYACDMFMANSSAKATMLASTNWEYILKDKVPTMTSDSAPYGESSASSVYGIEKRKAYNAFNGKIAGTFDGNDGLLWGTNNSVHTNAWIQYKFTNPICVKKVALIPGWGSTGQRVKNFKIQASNIGTDEDFNAHTLYSDISTDDGHWKTEPDYFDFSNDEYFLYYRLVVVDEYEPQWGIAIDLLQFYGRSLNVSVPTMSTDNTTPYGKVIYDTTKTWYNASGSVIGNPSIVFNGYTTSGQNIASLPSSDTSTWIGYKFTKKEKINVFGIWGNYSSGNYKITIEASNDDTFATKTQLKEYTYTSSNSKWSFVEFANNTEYLCYRANVENISAGSIAIAEMQFYGVDYSERDFEVDSSGALTNNVKYIYDHGVEVETITYDMGASGVSASNVNGAITLVSGSASSGSYAGATYSADLSNYDLVRAKIKDITVSYNTTGKYFSADITVDNDTSYSYLTTSQLPNNISHSIFTIKKITNVTLAAVSGGNGKVEYVEWWLE